jgi:cell division protein FtsL
MKKLWKKFKALSLVEKLFYATLAVVVLLLIVLVGLGYQELMN